MICTLIILTESSFVVFTDGVLIVDPSELDGRKGTISICIKSKGNQNRIY